MSAPALFGLSTTAREAILARTASRAARLPAAPSYTAPPLGDADVVAEIAGLRRAGALLGLSDPYFRVVDGMAGATVRIGGRHYDNFTSYDYLGLAADPRVRAAAHAAIDAHGTSVSASRIVSGERAVHRALEAGLAELHGTEDALALVSGHATNVTVIPHLVGAGDVILHDALSHNSIVQGARASRARRISFPHNDLDALERMLADCRPAAARALVVVEGHYSMDGDVPDLARLVAIARRWGASLMVDEAHSLGVLGATGRGIAERSGVDPSEVDVWMGTLSKTLAGCGGYICGGRGLVDYLRFSAPGFVYSVGLPPPIAAAALEALRVLRAEPQRVARLNANAALFLETARARGLDVGASVGAAIVPVLTGSSILAARAAAALFEDGINVQPIIHPAVPERAARLRFFVGWAHTEAQLRRAVKLTAQALGRHGQSGA